MSRDTIRLPHDAYWLLQTLRAAGQSAYVVGGCVRDSLLGRMPGDWDRSGTCFSSVPTHGFPPGSADGSWRWKPNNTEEG